jgi:hypothetical protein
VHSDLADRKQTELKVKLAKKAIQVNQFSFLAKNIATEPSPHTKQFAPIL